MTKQKCAVQRKRRYKALLKLASGFTGRRKNCYRIAKPIVHKALQEAYKGRRLLKREKRREFILAINAACRHFGNIPFSKFIHLCRNSDLPIKNMTLKSIRDLVVLETEVFSSICKKLVAESSLLK